MAPAGHNLPVNAAAAPWPRHGPTWVQTLHPLEGVRAFLPLGHLLLCGMLCYLNLLIIVNL
jgi:hypothetical protein